MNRRTFLQSVATVPVVCALDPAPSSLRVGEWVWIDRASRTAGVVTSLHPTRVASHGYLTPEKVACLLAYRNKH